MQGTANIMEDAIYGAIPRSSSARAYGPRHELFKGLIRTQTEQPGSMVNRFSARHLHKSEVRGQCKVPNNYMVHPTARHFTSPLSSPGLRNGLNISSPD